MPASLLLPGLEACYAGRVSLFHPRSPSLRSQPPAGGHWRLVPALAAGLVLAVGQYPASAQVTADPGAADRAKAWNSVLVWDAPAIKAVNLGLASPPMDLAMQGLSSRLLLVGAPLAAVPYTWTTRGMSPALELAGTIAAAELASAGLGFGLKAILDRPRPYLVDSELQLHDAPEDTSAMPSGHAAISFAWATVVAHDEPALAIPAYGLAAAIGFSRVYVGVHYPSDVLVGALLGYGTGLAVLAGRDALKQRGLLPAF